MNISGWFVIRVGIAVTIGNFLVFPIFADHAKKGLHEAVSVSFSQCSGFLLLWILAKQRAPSVAKP